MEYQIYDNEYEKAEKWLFSQLPMFSRIGAPAYKPGLQTTEKLDEIYGHPHRKFKSIHIGGTNGKGSTSHMIASVLQAQGYKTGLYTSPHLVDFRERIKINGEMIPYKAVVDFVEGWKCKNSELKPSFFELTMMMAFDWFAKEKVDIAVIEVGMGGRLDSTNIISPLISVITNISFDHTQFLGDTLEAIAREKAGITKPGVPVVIGEAKGAIRSVFENKATETGSPIIFAEDKQTVKEFIETDDGWRALTQDYGTIDVPLGGLYQQKNITTVLTTLKLFNGLGIKITNSSVIEGLETVVDKTSFQGRWQKVGETPVIICDTGHNEDGLTLSLQTLRTRYKDKQFHFLIGFVNDKNVAEIVELFPRNASYYFTQASIPRAMKAEEVAVFFQKRGIKGTIDSDIKSAFKKVLNNARPDDIIYVGGSTFIVADFLKFCRCSPIEKKVHN